MNVKYKKIFVLIIICVVIACVIGTWSYNKKQSENLKYCKEYIIGNENIKGNIDKERFERISYNFEIGANKFGYAVFKKPENAMKELKSKYSLGIELIKNEFKLQELSNDTMEQYKEYGDQVTTGSDEEKKEAVFVSEFLDIYENSFKK